MPIREITMDLPYIPAGATVFYEGNNFTVQNKTPNTDILFTNKEEFSENENKDPWGLLEHRQSTGRSFSGKIWLYNSNATEGSAPAIVSIMEF